MSDYKHIKAVRLPFPNDIMLKCNVDDIFDCEPYLKKLLGDIWDSRNKNCFKLVNTNNGHYIDWIYYSTYGEESGDFGFVRMLTKNELNVIKPYFDKLCVDYKDEDLRVVNYCYYNSCEAPDYYNMENNDDGHLFIN